MTLLVNKFYALPEGYQPSDLVPLEDYACVQGEDYSCQTVEQIEMRKEAYDAYVKFCKAAAKTISTFAPLPDTGPTNIKKACGIIMHL